MRLPPCWAMPRTCTRSRRQSVSRRHRTLSRHSLATKSGRRQSRDQGPGWPTRGSCDTLPRPRGTRLQPRLLSHRLPQALACRAGPEVHVNVELQGMDLQRDWAVLLPGGSWVVRSIKISTFPDSHCSSIQAVVKVLWVVGVKSTVGVHVKRFRHYKPGQNP